jgi:methylated-DNA-[protein]-cysteine S-methyltransferase
MKNIFYYNFPVGELGVIEENQKITGIFFKTGKKAPGRSDGFIIGETALLKKTSAQLKEYFRGQRTAFDIPLLAEGTVFQKSVWEALQKIPYGKTCSYKDIAAAAGNVKACRAAGMANNRNPIVIIIPCHRVIGADGSLTGYGGGLDKKRYLLELEHAVIKR